MNITKKIPPVTTFDLPEGLYHATLTQYRPMTKQTKKGPQEWVRLLFEVQIPEMANQIPCAGRNFQLDLNAGSDLRNFLEVWLGSDFFKEKSNQELNFDTLMGKGADVKLSHYLGGDYEKPLVIIDNAFPLNSQKVAESKPKTVAPVYKD
jgi:hypothetical protein